VGPAVVGEPVLADEHRGVDTHVAVVVERDELERLAQVDVAAPVEPVSSGFSFHARSKYRLLTGLNTTS